MRWCNQHCDERRRCDQEEDMSGDAICLVLPEDLVCRLRRIVGKDEQLVKEMKRPTSASATVITMAWEGEQVGS